MTVVLVVLAVLLLVALGRWGFRSMLSERRSVRNYLHAMEVLGEISRSQAAGGRVTANGSPAKAQRGAEPRPAPRPRPRQATARAPAAEKAARRSSRVPLPEGWSPPEPPVLAPPPGARSPQGPLVFVSEELADEASSPAPAAGPAPPPGEPAPLSGPELSGTQLLARAEDQAPPPPDASPEPPPWRHQGRTRRRRRRAGLVPALALVVAAAAGTAGALAASGHHPPARPLGQPEHRSQPAPPKPVPPPAVFPASSDVTQAVYQVARPSFSVLLSASGPCWVELRQGQFGPMIWEGTLTQGQTRLQPSDGPLWVRLGNPANISVSLDGLPVSVPVPPASPPYNLSFVPQ